MKASVTALATAASFMAIPASALVALPTVVEVFARRSGNSEDFIVHQIISNPDLRKYAEQMCLKGMVAL